MRPRCLPPPCATTGNRGDAEDLVQETFVRALVAWDRFRQGSNCRAWMQRILTNCFINAYRRRLQHRRALSLVDSWICPNRQHEAEDPEQTWIERRFSDEVRRALDQLPEDARRVVELADLQGLSYREIATQIGCPIGTVMSRLHRARRVLRNDLQTYAQEHGIIQQAA